MRALLDHWQVWALLSAGFAALTAIFAKVGVDQIDPDAATLIRTVIIVAIAAAIVAFQGSWPQLQSIAARTWLFLVLSGAATGLSWLCYFRALKIGDAARVAPIDKLSVVFVAVFAVLFMRERLSTLNWVGIMLIALGAILVAQRA